MDRHKVAITGIGLVNPLGNRSDTVWERLINGEIPRQRDRFGVYFGVGIGGLDTI